MFLKSLSMKGFKSFADPTVLEFEPGITVVVGPNGSGKSNVVDAVTWVLGAQGPRSLRSAKMEDVIFAGTSSRAALGRAEVSLTIDNASGKLPIDLAEVTITRTLFRSGDSEYAINGAPCRLLDVQELLSDSGVGRQQHMIIGQGQLDTVLNARPEDRRAIIEEAAGVLKHRRRRERAERRLAGTAENLERLGDLVREVRRQIRPLERQAAAARSHDTVATELLTIRRYLAGTELAELSQPAHRGHPEPHHLPGGGARAPRRPRGARRRGLDHLGRALLAPRRGPGPGPRPGAGTGRAGPGDLGRAARAGPRGDRCARCGGGRRRGLDPRGRGGAPGRRDRAWRATGRRRTRSRPSWRPRRAGWTPRRRRCGTAGPTCSGTTCPRMPWPRCGRARSRWPGPWSREQQDMTALDARLAGLEQRHAAAAVRADLLDNESAALEATTARLEAAVAAGRVELEGAAERAEAAQRRADEGDQARHRSAARAEALERALRDLQGAGGRELLRGVDGVVGSLLDLVEIDEGWEAAFEAAAGAGVAAVVVDGRQSAHQALATLRERGVTGAVLAPRTNGAHGAHGGTRRHRLALRATPAPRPPPGFERPVGPPPCAGTSRGGRG